MTKVEQTQDCGARPGAATRLENLTGDCLQLLLPSLFSISVINLIITAVPLAHFLLTWPLGK